MKTEDPMVIVTERTRQHLLTVQEYAAIMRVHPLTIYRLIQDDRQLGVVRVGRHIRINYELASHIKSVPA